MRHAILFVALMGILSVALATFQPATPALLSGTQWNGTCYQSYASTDPGYQNWTCTPNNQSVPSYDLLIRYSAVGDSLTEDYTIDSGAITASDTTYYVSAWQSNETFVHTGNGFYLDPTDMCFFLGVDVQQKTLVEMGTYFVPSQNGDPNCPPAIVDSSSVLQTTCTSTTFTYVCYSSLIGGSLNTGTSSGASRLTAAGFDWARRWIQ